MRIGWVALALSGCLTKPTSPAGPGSGDTYAFVRVGGRHACAIDQGALYCWGDNRLGQIGATTDTAVLSPTRVEPSQQWADVATGGTHTCALHDGTVMCWGDNSYGQVLGTPSAAEPVPVSPVFAGTPPRLDQIFAGQESSCAIDGGGALWCWGNVIPNQPVLAPTQIGSDQWSSISIGATFACGIQSSNGNPMGTVACFGENTAGEADPNDLQQEPVTAPTVLADVPPAFAVVAGEAQACALVGTPGQGELYCWGYNGDGLFGPPSQTMQPTKIGSRSDWSDIALGKGMACGIRGSHVVCWGTSATGGFGLGRWAGMTDVDHAGEALQADAIQMGVMPDDGDWTEMACAHDNGSVTCWGDNSEGELAIGSRSFQPVPVEVPLPKGATMWMGVGAGDRHTCGITDQGVYCWGGEDLGQITGVTPGFGGTDNPCTASSCDQPVPVAAPGLQSGQPIQDLVVGADFTCARQNSQVTCWGNGTTGELGTAMTGHGARTMSGTWTSLVGGPQGACALPNASLSPSCWGTFATSFSTTPQPVTDNNLLGASGLVLADQFACAIASMGNGYNRVCWGANDTYQLGDGSTTAKSTPQIESEGPLMAIAAAGKHGCEVIGTVVSCWGDNSDGQTGQSDTSAPTITPKDVSDGITGGSLSGCVQVAAAPNYSCAICTAAGGGTEVKCWGRNDAGELGRPDSTAMPWQAVPVELSSPHMWGQIATGARHACALNTMAHRLFCWGRGEHGEIGDGGHAVNVPTPLGPRAP